MTDGAWLRFTIGLVVVAACATAFAIGFRLSLSAALGAIAAAPNVVVAMRGAPWYARLACPALGGLVAGIAARFAARDPQGRGLVAVMEAVVLGRTRISLRTTLLKSFGSLVAIGSGGSLGREGPLIQLGGASGSWIGGKLRLPPERVRVLVGAGVAAGFAAAYNTPFAAVLFVVEIVSGVAALELVVPAAIAVVVATAATRLTIGAGPIYGARAFTLVSPAELLAFALLAVVATIVAQLFMTLLHGAERAFCRSRLPLPWRPAVGGLLTGALIVFMPDVAGNGYEPLNAILDGHASAAFLATLLVAKLLATASSTSSGSPGGVFTPSLLLGGAVGALYAHAAAAVLGAGAGVMGGYALVGMAAVTAATTHAPLMAAVMAFELSGDYGVVLPLLVATALASGLSRRLRRTSIYTSEFRERGPWWQVTLAGRRGSDPDERAPPPGPV